MTRFFQSTHRPKLGKALLKVKTFPSKMNYEKSLSHMQTWVVATKHSILSAILSEMLGEISATLALLSAPCSLSCYLHLSLTQSLVKDPSFSSIWLKPKVGSTMQSILVVACMTSAIMIVTWTTLKKSICIKKNTTWVQDLHLLGQHWVYLQINLHLW